MVTWVVDEPSGLRACIAVRSVRDGRSAGGIRVRAYPDAAAQQADAEMLASAMARKAVLNDVPSGGAKVVVLDHEGLARTAAMERLGEAVERRAGALWVGPDYGFTSADREAVARKTRYIDTDTVAEALGPATARGVAAALAAALGPVAGLELGVLGTGTVGLPLVERLVAAGATVWAWDVDERARVRAERAGARIAREEELIARRLDGLAPCALGGWLDVGKARRVGARVVAGSANGILASAEAGRVLHERGVRFVPDELSSAGAFAYWAAVVHQGLDAAGADAVVDGIGPRVAALLGRAEGRQPEVVVREEAERLLASEAAR